MLKNKMSNNKELLTNYANNLFKNAISVNKLELVPIIEKAKAALADNSIAHSEILKTLNYVSRQISLSVYQQ